MAPYGKSIFEISTEKLDLELKHPFTISRGTRKTVQNILVTVRAEGITGMGEAAPNHRYGETRESSEHYIQGLADNLRDQPLDYRELAEYIKCYQEGEFAAKAGLEMALYDWIGKKEHIPLYKKWMAPGRIGPCTTFTIGIDQPESIRQKVREAAPYPRLKIKLGSTHDKEIIRTLSEVTDKPLLVDANESWTTLDQAIEMIRFLEQFNVYIVEQPMPAGCDQEMMRLKKRSAIPLFADESVTGSEPMEKLVNGFHGINIKLMKTGGLDPSFQLLKKARNAEMKIMVGCMLQSAVADTASALVALWADYADIDGHLLVTNNPCKGVSVLQDGTLELPDGAGLGLRQMRV